MIAFLLLFFTIYTLAHYYLLHKCKKAGLPLFREFGLRWQPTVLLAVVTLFLVAAPVIVQIMDRAGLEIGPELTAYISYSWMGLLFLFISLSIFTDLILFSFFLFPGIRGKNTFLPRKTGAIFLIQVLLVLGIYGYGVFEARNIKTEHLLIRSPLISRENGRIRLVQISDVHLGLIVGKERLTKILAKVREAQPDILIATGDLVDGQPDNLEEVSRMLAAVRPPLGKLAVTGNHEFYAGLDKALAVTGNAGFQVLRNRSLRLAGISFSGLDDPTALRFGRSKIPDGAGLLQDQPRDHFRILLKHRPVVAPNSLGLFNLQLSGHTHKGQIFPFSLITRLFYPRPSGLSRLEQGCYLYHSRGTGTWGPPIRFLSPPEITLIDLVYGKESAIKIVK